MLPLCCHAASPPENQCPDMGFLLRKAFSDNVIWGCARQQLLLLDELLETSPCSSSASGCFLSHACYETHSRTEKFTGSWCQNQEYEKQMYYLILQRFSLTELGTGSPAHSKQVRAISRQRYCDTVLPLSPYSTQKHDTASAKGIFCFGHI